MTTIVLDASAVIAWLIPSQATANSDRLLNARRDYELLAPDIFGWEVTNVLLGRARRAAAFDLELALGQLASYDIHLAPPLVSFEREALMGVADVEGLSLFDAAYLSLAMESEASLASKDGDLVHTALRHGIPVHDLND